MNAVWQVIKEQIFNLHLIVRLAAYETRSKYQMHYLGMLWQFLNPTMQVLVFWVVFGLGIRGGQPVGDIPFFVYLVTGLIPWFFISPTVIQASNSVYSKVKLVSKMKFPVSVLPSIVIVGNAAGFLIMLLILAVILLVNKINPGLYILQLPYYLLSTFIFLYTFSLLSSTIATLVRDFQLLLQSMMRMAFFLTPIFWVPTSMPDWLQGILKLNPLYYLIMGYRDTFLGGNWFFYDISYMAYFWLGVAMLGFVGSYIHIRFKRSFVDYL